VCERERENEKKGQREKDKRGEKRRNKKECEGEKALLNLGAF